MADQFDMDAWTRELRQALRGTDDESAIRFCELADLVIDRVDLATARVLVSMLGPEGDCGLNEHVESVLASAADSIRAQAVLEELPRLAAETPDLATAIVETELRFHREPFVDTALSQSGEIRDVLRPIVEALVLEYPEELEPITGL